jgi:hypothetical protein
MTRYGILAESGDFYRKAAVTNPPAHSRSTPLRCAVNIEPV